MCAKTRQTDKPIRAEQSPHGPGCSQCPQLLPFPTLSPASTLSVLLFRGLQINSQTLPEEFKAPFQGGGWQLFLDERPWAGGSLASSDNRYCLDPSASFANYVPRARFQHPKPSPP